MNTKKRNKENLKQYLIDTAGYSEEEVNDMTDYDMFEKYLVWNGICGYTDNILYAVSCAFNIEIHNTNIEEL